MAAPYSLSIGASVLAKVVAFNLIGDSLESGVGMGAIIKLSYVPDSPTLTQNLLITTQT